jgi:hypothetical protein
MKYLNTTGISDERRNTSERAGRRAGITSAYEKERCGGGAIPIRSATSKSSAEKVSRTRRPNSQVYIIRDDITSTSIASAAIDIAYVTSWASLCNVVHTQKRKKEIYIKLPQHFLSFSRKIPNKIF